MGETSHPWRKTAFLYLAYKSSPGSNPHRELSRRRTVLEKTLLLDSACCLCLSVSVCSCLCVCLCEAKVKGEGALHTCACSDWAFLSALVQSNPTVWTEGKGFNFLKSRKAALGRKSYVLGLWDSRLIPVSQCIMQFTGGDVNQPTQSCRISHISPTCIQAHVVQNQWPGRVIPFVLVSHR